MKQTIALWALLLACVACSDSTTGYTWLATGWEAQESGTQEDLVDVFFLDREDGWALSGSTTVLRTTDGGRSWRSSAIAAGVPDKGRCLWFTDTANGWALMQSGLLYRTRDGGETWETQRYYDDSSTPYSSAEGLHFSDALHGRFHAGNFFFRTVDGGETWLQTEILHRDSGTIEAMEFFDHRRGRAVGGLRSGYGAVMTTEDGGEHWTVLSIDSSVSLWDNVDFVDEETGWATVRQSLFRTVDGGRTWEWLYSGYPPINVLCFADRRTGWMVEAFSHVQRGSTNYEVVLYTDDGGETWAYQNKVTTFAEQAVDDLFFLDSSTGWAVGPRGTIWHTTTGGLP